MRDVKDTEMGRPHEPGIVEFSVFSKSEINGKRSILQEGLLRSNDKAWITRRKEVAKEIRSILKYHAVCGNDPFCCVFFVHTETGVDLCRMAYDPNDRRMN